MKNKTKKLLSMITMLCLVIAVLHPIPAYASSESFLSSFKIAKKVIYKGNGVTISVNSAKAGSSGLKIEFYVKNSSKNDYEISAHAFAVNHLMAGGNAYGPDVSVPAGKNAKFQVSVNKKWFQKNGIKTFKTFDVMFWGYVDLIKKWDSGKVSFATNRDNKKGYYSPGKTKIYADKNIIVNYLKNNKDTYTFCVKNNTKLQRRWSVEHCSVNDLPYDLGSCMLALNSNPILDGCYAVFELVVDKSFKEIFAINKIKKIEYRIEFERAIDAENNIIERIKSGKIRLKR